MVLANCLKIARKRLGVLFIASTAYCAWGVSMVTAQTPGMAAEQKPAITIIHAGNLIAIPGEQPEQNVSVVVNGAVVQDVKQGFLSETDARTAYDTDQVVIIDLKDKWVLPGLIDAHVHFASTDPSKLLAHSDAHLALYALANAQKTLKAGFTTVRDLGSPANVVKDLRDAVDGGIIDGPRIVAGSYLSKVGMYGSYISGYRKEVMDALARLSNQCVGVIECERKVRELHKEGMSVIKVAVDHSASPQDPASFSDEELTAIVSTAKSLGMTVGAHAHSIAGINAALKAGVNSVEHGTFANAASLKLFKDKGAFFVPTLFGMEEIKMMMPHWPAEWQTLWKPAIDNLGNTAKEAHKTGVKIAFGTDAGVSPHGRNAEEFALMVRYGGLSPAEALKAGTVNAAELLGLGGKVGVIKQGSYADIIAVGDDPLKNIDVLRTVTFIMKNGREFR